MTVIADFTAQRGTFTLSAQLHAPPGVTVIFGPSGSGKTTVLQTIAGLIPLQTGSVSIAGQDMAGVPPHKRKIGYVFQNARLFPHLNVSRNLTYAARAGAHVDPTVSRDVIDMLELQPLLQQMPAQLSGGQAQRVALGRALLSDPMALCMDEPLSALDHALKQRILPYFERLRQATTLPMLYVTHDPAEMARLADHIVLMKDGKTVMSGPATDILSDPSAVPILGVRAAGTVITATVSAPDRATGLSRVSFPGGTLVLPDIERTAGRDIRLRVAAQDIILATQMPQGLSALNILQGQITQIFQGKGPGVIVQFAVGPTRFLARITRYSMQDMQLAVGAQIFAIVKASAFDPAGIGT